MRGMPEGQRIGSCSKHLAKKQRLIIARPDKISHQFLGGNFLYLQVNSDFFPLAAKQFRHRGKGRFRGGNQINGQRNYFLGFGQAELIYFLPGGRSDLAIALRNSGGNQNVSSIFFLKTDNRGLSLLPEISVHGSFGIDLRIFGKAFLECFYLFSLGADLEVGF